MLAWRGDGTGNGTWDVATTPNFFDGVSASVFNTKDVANFDDTANGSGPYTVTIAAGGVVHE